MSYPMRIRLTRRAEQYLGTLADDLELGRVELWQLPPSIMALYTFGYEAGRRSRDAEVAALNRDADVWYAVAFNPSIRDYNDYLRARTAHLDQVAMSGGVS